MVRRRRNARGKKEDGGIPHHKVFPVRTARTAINEEQHRPPVKYSTTRPISLSILLLRFHRRISSLLISILMCLFLYKAHAPQGPPRLRPFFFFFSKFNPADRQGHEAGLAYATRSVIVPDKCEDRGATLCRHWNSAVALHVMHDDHKHIAISFLRSTLSLMPRTVQWAYY